MPDTSVPEKWLSSVGDGLRALRDGQPLILVDDAIEAASAAKEGQVDNHASVVLAAGLATERVITWTVRHSSGLLSVPMPDWWADRLGLSPMVRHRRQPGRAEHTVPVDARHGVSTGFSAHDRALTARVLADPATPRRDLDRPGHMFPVRVRPGGAASLPSHAEAAVDLCLLAGLAPVAVTAEVLTDDGRVAGPAAVTRLGARYQVPILSVGQFAAFRADPSARVRRAAETTLPTRHGRLRALGYQDVLTGAEHLVLASGVLPTRGALVRVQQECLIGETFGSWRCDCGPQLDAVTERITAAGGVLVYLRQPGNGGMLDELATYQMLDEAAPSAPRPAEYGAAAAILHDLDLLEVRLLTDDARQVEGLTGGGIAVSQRIPLEDQPS